MSLPNSLETKENFFVTGIIPDHNYRFVLARNTSIAYDVALRHEASSEIRSLMGEAMLGAFFLSTHTVKQEERTISLHLECPDPVLRIIAFSDSQGRMRAYSANPQATGFTNDSLDGLLRVNRWIQGSSQVYSSATSLRPVPLYKNIQEYVGKSEQIQTFIKLETHQKSDRDQISGYIFQALPGASADDTDAVLDMLSGLSPGEIMNSLLEQNDESLKIPQKSGLFLGARLLHTGHFQFQCDCSRDKIKVVIRNMGNVEAKNILEEQGFIEATCEFCKTKYTFNESDVMEILGGRSDEL